MKYFYNQVRLIRNFLLVISLMTSFVSISANATRIEYDILWQGDAGYTVTGIFSFEDENITTLVDESDLLSFIATAHSPSGLSLKTYDLTNMDALFNFNFNTVTQKILQSGFTTSSTGFLIGKGLAPVTADDWFFGGGTTGCASLGSPGIVLSLQGGCGSFNLDELGTDLIATLKIAKVSEPSTIFFFGGSLIILGFSRKKHRVNLLVSNRIVQDVRVTLFSKLVALNRHTKLMIVPLILVFSGAMNAGLINNGNHVTVNGVQWLDLSETDGWTYNETLALTDYHVASTIEFQVMFAQFADPNDQFGVDIFATEYCTSYAKSQVCYSTGDTGFVDNLFRLYFGATEVGSTSAVSSAYSYGWYADVTETRLGGIAAVDRLAPLVNDQLYEYHSGTKDYGHIDGQTTQWDLAGWFMVKNSVTTELPEPSILSLVALGLSYISFTRRRRSKLKEQSLN